MTTPQDQDVDTLLLSVDTGASAQDKVEAGRRPAHG